MFKALTSKGKKLSLSSILSVFDKTIEELEDFIDQSSDEEIDLITRKNEIVERLGVIDKEIEQAETVIKNIKILTNK